MAHVAVNNTTKSALTRLIAQKHPVLTISAISDIAEGCSISYGNVLKHVNLCRTQGIDMSECIVTIVRTYKHGRSGL